MSKSQIKLTFADAKAPLSSVCQGAVPFPVNGPPTLSNARLVARDGSSRTHQWRVMSRWPTGAVKWAMLDFIATPADETLTVEFDCGESIASASPHRGDITSQSQPGQSFSLDFETHRLGLSVRLSSGDGLQAVVREVKSLDSGPIRNSQRIDGELIGSTGTAVLNWFAQIDEFPSLSLTRIAFTLWNPRPAAHPGGIWELGDANSAILESAILKLVPQSSVGKGRLQYRMEHAADWQSADAFQLQQLGSGGEHFHSRVHRSASGEVHAPLQGYQWSSDGPTETGGRATPTLIQTDTAGRTVGIYVPRFWQNFPKSLEAKDGNIELGLFPKEFGQPFELQPGEQKTHALWIATGDAEEVRKTLDTVAKPPVVRVDPQWVCRSEVIPWLTPVNEDRNKDYLDLIDQVVSGADTFFDKRERIDEYGWRHFGDVWGDHEAVHSDPDNPLVSHYNNQYDMILGLGLNYLRGGDEKWLELMQDLARHVIDIDIYHTDDDLPCYNHGMFWHTVHYVDAGLSTHRTYPKGTCGGGPSSGHAYARGLMLYYCMTGDVAAREAVVKMGEWMIAAEDGSATKYRWLARGETGLTTASGTEDYHGPGRGPGNAVEVLVTAFELTHERRFLDQAEKIIRRVVHPDQDIAALDLLDAENKWFYNLFLQALGRYLEVKLSMRELDRMYAYSQRTLLRFADWMADHEYPYLDKPEKLEFPTETWAAQEMRKVEVFQWAARHATGKQRQRFLERAAFFFKTSCNQLESFADKKSLCRPMALLLTNGYSHDWFMQGGLEQIEPAPLGQDFDFGEPTRFVSQKVRAIRRAKLIVAVGALASLVVCAFVLGYVYL